MGGFAGRTDAPQVLADRLLRRLDKQLRTGGPITGPVGWLLARGLPQRQQCGDARCDGRVLLDSGRGCPRCEDRQVDRRAQRHGRGLRGCRDARGLRGRTPRGRRQLHERVTAQGRARAHEWAQVRDR